MEINFSLFNSNDLTTTSTALLQIVLDNIPTGIEVLKAVRKDNVIVDFEYILVNKITQKRSGKKLLGKKFLSKSENDPHLFSRMVEVTETGNTFQVLVNTEVYGSPRWFIHKYIKFEDGLIISKEDITEKKLSEQTALDTQEFIENIANSTPDIIYVLDLESRSFIYMNNRGYEIFGITEKEVREKGHDFFFQVTHPDDYIKRMNHFTRVGNDSSEHIHETEVRKKIKDGAYGWFRCRDKVFKRDKDGAAISIIGISTNIQEQKQAVLDLINQEEQYRTLVHNSPDIISRWNHDLKLIYVNPSLEDKTGIRIKNVLDKHVTAMGLPDAVALSWKESLEKVFKTGQPQEHFNALPTLAGENYFYARIVPEKNSAGQVETVLAIARDITAQKNAEEDLRKSREFLKGILDSSLDFIQVFKAVRNESGTIIDFTWVLTNKKWNEVYGDTIGKSLLKENPAVSQTGLFQKFVEVTETGAPVLHEHHYSYEQFDGWFYQAIVKMDDGFVLNTQEVTERKKTEQALEQQNASLANFKRIIDTTHNGITSLDRDGRINYWNRAAELIYGYSSEEVIGRKLDELIAIEKKKPDLTEVMIQVYRYGKSLVEMTTQKRRKDGRLIDVVINLFPLRDETGDITGSCMVTKDISEAKIAKEKMREDAHFIGQIVDTTPDIIYIMDLHTTQIIYANRQVAADLGYSKQQIASMKNPVFDIIYEEDMPAMLEHLKKMKTITSDDKVLEIEYRLKNAKGGYSWFCDRNVVFKRNMKKIPVEKIAVSQNITDRKKQEEEKRTSLDILHQSEEIAGIGSWEYDIPSEELKWSEGMYRLFNLDKGTPISPEIYLDYTLHNERSLVERIVNNILYEFVPFEETITLLPSGQESRIIKTKGVIQKDKKGKPRKIIGVDLDVTQHIKDHEEINNLYTTIVKKSKELQQLDHEIKTFHFISAQQYKETAQQLYTNLEYIVTKDARHLSDVSKANIRRAQSAIQKMNLLSDDINAYFKLYDMDVEIGLIDPNMVIKNLVNDYKKKLEQYDASVEYVDLPAFPSHPMLFSRLIGHLIDNAIKFRNLVVSPVIKIKYSQADELNAIPDALKNTPYGIISVSDNGIGFSEQEAENIFEISHCLTGTDHRKSPGIGLAVCKKIMAMHEGFITAEGTPAIGSIFNCYFPLRR